MLKEELAKRLREYRKKAGLTQADTALAVGVKRSSYAYYETGKISPSLETVKALSKMYNVSVSELLVEEGDDEELSVANNVATDDFDDRFNDLTEIEKTVIFKLRTMNRDKRSEIINQIFS